MPREVRTETTALINSGHCNWATTYDIVLTDGETLFLSSTEIHVNRFGKNQQYLARVYPDSIQELAMSADVEIDGTSFQMSNVDMIIGRLLTSNVRRLDGAKIIVGILFIDPTLSLSQAIWDAKISGFLTTGEVTDPSIESSVVSFIDLLSVSGNIISDEFQWQEPVNVTPVSDPNDIPPTWYPTGSMVEPFSGGVGRYGDYASPNIPMFDRP